MSIRVFLLLQTLVFVSIAGPAPSPQRPAPPAPACAGTDGSPIGRPENHDAALVHVGPLLGHWQSDAGTLLLAISSQRRGDVIYDALGASWHGRDGQEAFTFRTRYEAADRLLLDFPGGAQPGLSRLRLERDGKSLLASDTDKPAAPASRLTREIKSTVMPFERFAIARSGAAGIAVAGNTAKVTLAAGSRASGRLTGNWRLPQGFDVEITFRHASPQPADGSFICVGVVSQLTEAWDPYLYAMVGRVQRAGAGAFTMQTYNQGAIRRWTQVPATGPTGRLRLLREHMRVFALYDTGHGWAPLATQVVHFWDDLRLVVTFGNGATRGSYPAMDVVISDLRVTSG
ncbi:MAG: hypothetical protein WD690_13415 [Vicinamibacterales bacterium]